MQKSRKSKTPYFTASQERFTRNFVNLFILKILLQFFGGMLTKIKLFLFRPETAVHFNVNKYMKDPDPEI